MPQDYTELLDFLDNFDSSSLFSQKEEGFRRVPFDMELTLYRFIYQGRPQEMVAYYRSLVVNTPALRVTVGKTSDNRLRQMKYAAVSAIAIACRAAILGGAAESVAYGKSDESILELDRLESIYGIARLEAHTLLDFAAMVQQSRSVKDYSPEVKSAVSYIASHTHQNITLEELAGGVGYTKEYLAKLFRSQVGMPVSEYVLRVRMDEAKILLRQGRPCNRVSYLMGFSSQSYFIHQFKRIVGVTPKQYATIGPADSKNPLDD